MSSGALSRASAFCMMKPPRRRDEWKTRRTPTPSLALLRYDVLSGWKLANVNVRGYVDEGGTRCPTIPMAFLEGKSVDRASLSRRKADLTSHFVETPPGSLRHGVA